MMMTRKGKARLMAHELSLGYDQCRYDEATGLYEFDSYDGSVSAVFDIKELASMYDEVHSSKKRLTFLNKAL